MKAWQGQGAYGAVYRAERVGFRRSEPGALKVSLWPWDARMKREVQLLSRLSHPSIPRLQAAEAREAGAGGDERPERSKPPERPRAWKPWLALAAAAACAVLLWHSQPVPVLPGPMSASTAAVGDTSPTEPQASTPPTPENKPLAQEPLPEPSPGQARPDKKGQCPGRRQVPINGGCWVPSSMPAEECVENGGVLFRGKCFGPAREPPRKPPPTSNPPEAR